MLPFKSGDGSLNIEELGTGIVHNLDCSHETEENSGDSKYSNLSEKKRKGKD